MPFFYGNPGSFASIVETLSSSITVNNATTNAMFDLNQTAAANVIDLDNDSTEHGIFINQDGVLGASKYALYVYSNTAQVTSPLAVIKQDHASSSTDVLQLYSDGTGWGLFIDQNGDGTGLKIDSEASTTTKYGLEIYMVAGAVGLFCRQDGNFLNAEFRKLGTGAGTNLQLTNSGTGVNLVVDHNNSGYAMYIDVDVNDAAATYGMLVNVANAGAGLEYFARFDGSEIVAAAVGGVQDQKIRISIAGTDYFIPCHTA